MQLTGTLRKWNDERGFGFITPTQGGGEIFVHVSAFSRYGARPAIGERLAYELGPGRDGKPQATKVMRLAAGQLGRVNPARTSSTNETSLIGFLIFIALLAAAATWGYKHFTASLHRMDLAAQPASASQSLVSPATNGSFSCDSRTHCSQMTSCTEAKWFINNCPGTKMDGNHDGTPCEAQWCTSIFSK